MSGIDESLAPHQPEDEENPPFEDEDMDPSLDEPTYTSGPRPAGDGTQDDESDFDLPGDLA